MMTLLGSLHAIAAQRGDGLRPELLRLLEQTSENGGTGPRSKNLGPHVTYSVAKTAADPIPAEADTFDVSMRRPASVTRL